MPEIADQDPLTGALIENYLRRSLDAIESVGFLRSEERAQVISIYHKSALNAPERPCDILESLAILRHGAVKDAQFNALIRDLSYLLANSVFPNPIVIPFGVKMSPPAQFYELHPAMASAAKALLTPIIYCEDNETFGLISTNPVATELLKEEIENYFLAKSGVLPYVSCFRSDYADWKIMISKHFGL